MKFDLVLFGKNEFYPKLNNKTYNTRQTETGKNDYEADLARTNKNEISAANNVETFRESSEPMAASGGEGYSFI